VVVKQMKNFWNDPLKPYEKHRIELTDHASKEHYSKNMNALQIRIKLKMVSDIFPNMVTAKGTVYVFSESELKELLKA
jgi:hypothetical protein